MPPALALLRPRQWVKNLFVLAPLFFTPQALTATNVVRGLLGFVAFCAFSSAVYIVNDYLDREADRLHPEKRLRPLAAGTVAIPTAAALLIALLTGGLILALILSPGFAGIALVYLTINAAYSLRLKQLAIIDVMLVAFGFVLRVFAGCQLIDVVPSVWIIMCTGFLALFLAMAKRRDDVVKTLDQDHRASLRGYNRLFLDAGLTAIVASLLVAYVLYTTEPRHGSAHLYYTTPFVIAGVLRYLQITMVEERSGSPTTIATTDRFLILDIICWVVVFGAIIYAG